MLQVPRVAQLRMFEPAAYSCKTNKIMYSRRGQKTAVLVSGVVTKACPCCWSFQLWGKAGSYMMHTQQCESSGIPFHFGLIVVEYRV